MPEGPDLQNTKLVKKFEEMGITVNLNIRLYELDVNSRVKYLNKIGGYPTITFAQRDMTILMIFVKRMFDVVGGIVGLIFTGIITLILGPMIKLESPGPLFFLKRE